MPYLARTASTSSASGSNGYDGLEPPPKYGLAASMSNGSVAPVPVGLTTTYPSGSGAHFSLGSTLPLRRSASAGR